MHESPENFASWLAGDGRTPIAPPSQDVALLVVDMQNWYCKAMESVPRAPGREIDGLQAAIPGCVRLVEAARAAGQLVIFTRMVHLPRNLDQMRMGGRRAHLPLDDTFLAEGSAEAAIIDELTPRDGEVIIDKARPSAFHGTRLEPLLRTQGITSLVVCGVTTNICVEGTVRDAGQLGYDTYVVSDATGEFEPERHLYSLFTMDWAFGTVVEMTDVERGWASAAEERSIQTPPLSGAVGV